MAGGSNQADPTNFIPVRLSDGTVFYAAAGGGTSGSGGSLPPQGLAPKGFVYVAAATLIAAYAVNTSLPAGAKAVLMIAGPTGGDLNYRDDAVAPTGAVGGGMSFQAGSSIFLSTLAEINAFQAIAVTGNGAFLLLNFYG